MKLFDENIQFKRVSFNDSQFLYIARYFPTLPSSLFRSSTLEFLLLDRANCQFLGTRSHAQTFPPTSATRDKHSFSLSALLIVQIRVFPSFSIEQTPLLLTQRACTRRAACNRAIFPAGRRSRGDERGGKRRTKRR